MEPLASRHRGWGGPDRSQLESQALALVPAQPQAYWCPETIPCPLCVIYRKNGPADLRGTGISKTQASQDRQEKAQGGPGETRHTVQGGPPPHTHTHQNASPGMDPRVSSSCSRKARSQTSGSTVRPPHLSPHGLTGKTREFSHQETEVLFWQFPRCRGPHPAWSRPSPPWTRAGPATVPPDRAGVEVGETGVGPAPELQPLSAGQSQAEADTGRAAFLSEGHGGPLFSSLLSPAGLGPHRLGSQLREHRVRCQQYRG